MFSFNRRKLISTHCRKYSGRPTTVHLFGPCRVKPPFVAIIIPAGYGCSASAIRFSLTSGPYASAVSIKFTPRSGSRFRTRFASSRSFGSPHTPSPVMRIAPKPSRCTVRSPPMEKVPLALAFGVVFVVLMLLWIRFRREKLPPLHASHLILTSPNASWAPYPQFFEGTGLEFTA